MESYRVINKVPTKVLTFGKGIGDDLSGVKHIVLLFPGNPGIIDYYREFMKEIFVKLKSKYPKLDIPVWGVGHAGHQTESAHQFSFPQLDENPELYSLEGQWNHKIRFMESFIPSHINIIGIGHSIGCKIWLETMKRMDSSSESQDVVAEPRKRLTILKNYMLFPTIERMKHTPNGQSTWPLLNYSKYLLPLLKPLSFLPTFIHKWLVDFYFRGRTVPECAYPATLQLFNYDIVKRVAFMAKCELEQVVDLDTSTIKNYLEKLYFYFGTKDGWCPLNFADGMKAAFPNLNHKVCSNGYEHAFVLENGIGMANFICDQITFLEQEQNGQEGDSKLN